jgi:flagellar motor protein MotB
VVGRFGGQNPSIEGVVFPKQDKPLWVLGCLLVAVLAGCAENALVLKGQLQQLQQQQMALSRQAEELQHRANALDRDNQEKDVLLAQAQQRAQAAEAQVAALKEQLASLTRQLAQARQDQQAAETKVQALSASLQRRGSVPIEPNNSFAQRLPGMNLPGVSVRQDGELIRIELPGGTLFPQMDGRLTPEGVRLLAAVAHEIVRDFPDHRIGIQGHVGKIGLPPGSPWRSLHHLSYAEAMTVFDFLVAQTPLRADQLEVSGHGSNFPLVSNATPQGQQRNHRIELVIYPDKAAAGNP